MRRIPSATLMFVLVLAVGKQAWAEEKTRYILAPVIFQTDPTPDPLVVEGNYLNNLQRYFRGAFEKAFPGDCIPLSEDHKLDPDEPTVLVAPTLSVARITKSSHGCV